MLAPNQLLSSNSRLPPSALPTSRECGARAGAAGRRGRGSCGLWGVLVWCWPIQAHRVTRGMAHLPGPLPSRAARTRHRACATLPPMAARAWMRVASLRHPSRRAAHGSALRRRSRGARSREPRGKSPRAGQRPEPPALIPPPWLAPCPAALAPAGPAASGARRQGRVAGGCGGRAVCLCWCPRFRRERRKREGGEWDAPIAACVCSCHGPGRGVRRRGKTREKISDYELPSARASGGSMFK